MKILALALSLFSYSAPAAIETLNFAEPQMNIKKVTLHQPLQTNLLRLYLRLPSQIRMIAGYKSSSTINF